MLMPFIEVVEHNNSCKNLIPIEQIIVVYELVDKSEGNAYVSWKPTNKDGHGWELHTKDLYEDIKRQIDTYYACIK